MKLKRVASWAFIAGCCGVAQRLPAAELRGLGQFIETVPWSRASAISDDGQVVVGTAMSDNYTEPFRWTPKGGMQRLDNILTVITPGVGIDVSADGNVVVGRADFGNSSAFRWQDAGFRMFGNSSPSVANGVSADGSVAVGVDNFSPGGGLAPVTVTAFRWTAPDGLVPLADLPGGPDAASATAISANGNVIVGVGDRAASFQVEDLGTAVRWVNGAAPESLGYLPGGGWNASRAEAVSPDGAVIVGRSTSEKGAEPFLWTESAGMIGLGQLPGATHGTAEAVSSGGRFVVGSSGDEAFLWTKHLGMRNLETFLTDSYRINLDGWQLTSATAITPDGLFIAGEGINPDGETEGWWADLFFFPGDDGDIDLTDLNNVRNNFGGSTGGDMAPIDGIVDLYDLNMVRNYMGSVVPPQAVPEPSAALLACLGVTGLAIYRRVRRPLS